MPSSTESPLAYNDDPAKGGIKHDGDKLRWDLLPYAALSDVAAVFNLGAEKYTAWNWMGGMPYSRVFNSAQRHLLAFWSGEDNDPESGEPHIAHAAANLLFLLTYAKQGIGSDDRPGILSKPRTTRKR